MRRMKQVKQKVVKLSSESHLLSKVLRDVPQQMLKRLAREGLHYRLQLLVAAFNEASGASARVSDLHFPGETSSPPFTTKLKMEARLGIEPSYNQGCNLTPAQLDRAKLVTWPLQFGRETT